MERNNYQKGTTKKQIDECLGGENCNRFQFSLGQFWEHALHPDIPSDAHLFNLLSFTENYGINQVVVDTFSNIDICPVSHIYFFTFYVPINKVS